MRIVIYINIMDRGGAEGQVVMLARGLIERGHNLKLVTGTGKLAAVPSDIKDIVVEIPERPRLKRFILFYKFLREFKPDVLHNQMLYANTLGVLAGRLARVPAIFQMVLSTDLWKGKNQRRLERVGSTLASKTIANSEGVAENLENVSRINKEMIEVIYNGVEFCTYDNNEIESIRQNIRQKLSIPDEAKIIINVANLYPVKDQKTLIKAFDNCLRSANDSPPYLVLCGGGDEETSLRKLAEELRVTEYVKFTGWVDDVGQYLVASDIFCLTSVSEGFSNAVIEAMAAALPCVLTDVGGNSEAVQSGENGFIVPVGDIDEIALRLKQLLDDDVLRKKLGAKSRAIVEQTFARDKMIDDTIEIYQRFLSS